MVTLDFGCTVDGYNSDLTRTVFVGKPKSFALKLYKIVAEAQKHAKAMLLQLSRVFMSPDLVALESKTTL